MIMTKILLKLFLKKKTLETSKMTKIHSKPLKLLKIPSKFLKITKIPLNLKNDQNNHETFKMTKISLKHLK